MEMNSIKEDWTNKMEFTLNENRIFSICIVGFSKLHIISGKSPDPLFQLNFSNFSSALLSTFQLVLEFTQAKKKHAGLPTYRSMSNTNTSMTAADSTSKNTTKRS